jgi:hypothetical protein
MTNEEVEQLIATIEEVGLDNAAEVWGMSIKEIIDIYPVEEYLDATNQFPYKEEESTPFTPDYSKTEEFEGEGITSEFLPGDSMVADSITWLAEKAGIPPEAALAMAGVVGKNPKNIKKGVEGMFTPRKNKGNQLTDKRGTKSGEVVGTKKGATVDAKTQAKSQQHMQKKYGDADKNTKQMTKVEGKGGPLTPTKNAGETKRFGLTRKNELKTAAGLTTGLAANRMLNGNRNDQGDFVEAPKEEVETAPTAPVEQQGNQYGYHKQEGQNFWTVNNDDPYWDTHEMGTGDAWSDAEVKKAPAKELDWSSWFN